MEEKKSKLWGEEEKLKLIKLYPNTETKKIAEILNRSVKSIDAAARRCKIKRSDDFKKKVYEAKKELVTKRNKTVGRDLTTEKLAEIAKQFKTRSDFQDADSSAYNTAKNNGILDDICKHMLKRSVSRPQLILRNIMDKLLNAESVYNDRKIIKPYEIDIYYPEFNLAIEYQGKFWHGKKFKENNDTLKKELLTKKNINLIYIFENTRKYELDIKEQIKNNLNLINSITNKNISFSDIDNIIVDNIYHKIYGIEEMLNIAKKYSTIKEFKEKEKYVWYRLNEIKKYREATSHMSDKKNVYNKNDLTNIKDIISKYTELKDLIENDHGTYLYIKRNKELEYLLNGLNKKIIRYNFNIDEIKNTISKYEKKCDFYRENKAMYTYLERKKMTSLFSNLKNCR
jgi:hypothetical protein